MADEVSYADHPIRATLQLCDLLFFEFKTSDEPEILQELHNLTQSLLNLAKIQQASPLLAETYGLQARLVLLQLDIPCAQQLLTQAQILTEDTGMERLAQSLSHEGMEEPSPV